MVRFAGAAAVLLVTGGGAWAAGTVERACLSTGSASDRLCQCIQDVANMTLTSGDQRRAAKFFVNPDKAQAARASDSQSAEAFWSRYSNFAVTAEAACSPAKDDSESG